MKQIINKVVTFYKKGDNAFYISLLGPLAMGTLHLIMVLIHFDWIFVSYYAFSYLVAIFKTFQWAIEKYKYKFNHYVAGIISIGVLIVPMIYAFILTILYKSATHYIFDWLIYAYALYGTIKMVLAIKNLIKKEKSPKQYVLSYLGLIGALYTIQMMEFELIMMFDDGLDNSMYLLQLFSQGAIFLFAVFVIVLFARKIVQGRSISKK